MSINHRDRLALRAALEKLSASASAMADASADINALVARMETVEADTPPTTTTLFDDTPSTHSRSMRLEPLSLQVPRNVPHIAPLVPIDHWPLGSSSRMQTPAASLTPSLAPPLAAPLRQPLYPTPQRPARPTKPRMTTEEKIMRGVAIGGATITIAGIILLVSVAIQRGWLGPLGRVLGAYLLAVALFASAAWVRKRGTRIEAIVALTITSHIAAIATTSALIFVLNWWPPGIGSAIILAINCMFLLVGRQWSSGRTQESKGTRAQIEGSAVLLAASIITGLCAWYFGMFNDAWWPALGILVALLISARTATAPIRATLATMAVLLQFFQVTAWDGTQLAAAILGIISAITLVTLTLWDPVHNWEDEKEGIDVAKYWQSFESNPVPTAVGAIAPVLIILATAIPLISIGAVWWSLLPAATMSILGLHASLGSTNVNRSSGAHTDMELLSTEFQRVARLIAVTGISLTAAVFLIIRYNGAPMNPENRFADALPVIIFLGVGAGLLLWQRSIPKDKSLGLVPWVAWMLAAVAITGVLFRNVVTLAPLWLSDLASLVQAVMILVFISAAMIARQDFYNRPLWLQLLIGATLLYLSATAIVTITTFFGHLIGGNIGMQLGFLIGHATVSILWMAIAAGLMLSTPLLDKPGALWTGVGLALAGTVKLVFFDLVALDGVPRAIAFLISGIALLSIAAMRGRRTSQESSLVQTAPEESEI